MCWSYQRLYICLYLFAFFFSFLFGMADIRGTWPQKGLGFTSLRYVWAVVNVTLMTIRAREWLDLRWNSPIYNCVSPSVRVIVGGEREPILLDYRFWIVNYRLCTVIKKFNVPFFFKKKKRKMGAMDCSINYALYILKIFDVPFFWKKGKWVIKCQLQELPMAQVMTHTLSTLIKKW